MNAQTFLVQQLSSLVTSRTDMTINADNNSSEQQFYNLSKTISNLRLDGLQFMTCKDEDVKKKKNQGENDEVYAICYISKEDLNRSAGEVSKTVKQYLELYEQKKNLGLDGLSELYIAYLNTFFTPLTISHKFGSDSISNIRPYLETRLRNHLSELQMVCTKVEEHPQYPDEQLRLTLMVKGESSVGMVYFLDCPAINASAEISEITTQFNVLVQPSAPEESFSGTLTLGTIGLSEPLKSIADAVPISRQIEFTADMTSIISIDFAMDDKGDFWQMTPKFRHLSVNSFEWSSNSKRLSTEQMPKILKEDVGSDITLKLNRNESLAISKRTKASTSMQKRYEPQSVSSTAKNEQLVDLSAKEPKPSPSEDDVYGFANLKDFGTVQVKLAELKKDGKVIFGKKDKFLRPERCWVLLIEPSTKQLKHVLTSETPTRKDLVSGEIYEDFENQLKGFIAIWLELY